MGAIVSWGLIPPGMQEVSSNGGAFTLSFGDDEGAGDFTELRRSRFVNHQGDRWISATALGPTSATVQSWDIERDADEGAGLHVVRALSGDCQLVVLGHDIESEDLLRFVHGTTIHPPRP